MRKLQVEGRRAAPAVFSDEGALALVALPDFAPDGSGDVA
jgi:hypothetical protein